jgi:hypothetical protein
MRSLCATGLALVVVILSAAMGPPRAAAQSTETAAARLTFEVASVRYDILAKSEEPLIEDPHLSHSGLQAIYDRQR